MSSHIVALPKAFWVLKIVQTVLSVLILAFSAFSLYCALWSTHAFAVFTALFTIIILVYYFVAIHGSQKLYNWIALLVLECLAVIFWLSTWAASAALYALYAYRNSYYDYTFSTIYTAYMAISITNVVFGVIQFVLYCVTLGLLGAGIHRHRNAGHPFNAGSSGVWPADGGEKAEMHNMAPPPAPAYSHYEPNQQHQVAPSPGAAYHQGDAHEMNGNNRY